MFQPVWKKLLWMAALVVAGMTFSADSAQAGWGHRYGGWYGCGYYPAYAYTAPYCSPCVARCGWGYRGCWSGCYSGCYSPCWTPWYGCYGVVSDCCGSTVVESAGASEAAPTLAPTPATPPAPAAEESAAESPAPAPTPTPAPAQDPAPAAQPAPAADAASAAPAAEEPKAVPAAPDVNLPPLPEMPALPPAPGDAPKPTAQNRLPADAAQLTVVVPEDAQVFVNGTLTKSQGAERRYVSYGLKPGYQYTYEVRAVVTRDGETSSDVQVVRVRVGESRDLAFDFAAQPEAVIAARLP